MAGPGDGADGVCAGCGRAHRRDGRSARRLHALPAPPIDFSATGPVGSLPDDLHQHPEALTSQQRDWLLNRCADITAACPTIAMPTERDDGLIHGDAHTGNLIPTPGGLASATGIRSASAHAPRTWCPACTASSGSAAP
ncbi:phosphotransferase [Actinomadura litoris]|uniref:phosphotransferase n=1 Tax=Actinomadura litoris TaxID=2678616 RepID=UPI00355698DF